MEAKKYSRPNSEEIKARGKSKVLPKQSTNAVAKVKRVLPSKDLTRCVTPTFRSTLIPKLKSEDKTNASPTRRGHVKNTASCPLEREMQIEELDEKLRLIEAKEKSIADYYEKIKELNKKVLELQKGHFSSSGSRISRAPSSSTSFELLGHSEEQSELLSSFEKNIYQISEIWLRTSLDLSNVLGNFRSNPSWDSDHLQMENSKIQLAIKQATSLTLIKTKNVIAEAKKLLNPRELVLNELEGIAENCKERIDVERGDSKKIIDDSSESPTTKKCDRSLNGKGSYSGEVIDNKNSKPLGVTQADIMKKNETIALLNNKIFEIQKACNEHLLENSQLQYKIAEMNEKNQWNQVFWKQISKLKDRIKMLQQNNRQLEAQKKELELKMANVNLEIDKVTRLNHLLRQQIAMSHEKQANANRGELHRSDRESERDCSSPPSVTNTIVLQEKENIIEELKNILILMKGQETFAHQKISEFETKIEEFKK